MDGAEIDTSNAEEVVVEEAQSGAVEAETEARALGWKPEAEYTGPKDKWKPAEDFLKARNDHLGMLRENNEKLSRKVRDLEKKMSRAEREGFTRAMEMVAAKQRAAVETGDTEAFDAAKAEEKKLMADAEKPVVEEDDTERREKFIEWRIENEWYGKNDLLTEYANVEAEKIAKQKGAHLDDDDLAEVAKRTRARFVDKHPEAFGIVKKDDEEAPARRRSAVDGAPMNRGKGGGKTEADLDSRAIQIADQLIRQGLFASRAEYAKELFK